METFNTTTARSLKELRFQVVLNALSLFEAARQNDDYMTMIVAAEELATLLSISQYSCTGKPNSTMN